LFSDLTPTVHLSFLTHLLFRPFLFFFRPSFNAMNAIDDSRRDAAPHPESSDFFPTGPSGWNFGFFSFFFSGPTFFAAHSGDVKVSPPLLNVSCRFADPLTSTHEGRFFVGAHCAVRPPEKDLLSLPL